MNGIALQYHNIELLVTRTCHYSASKIMNDMYALELLISRFLAVTVVFFALFTTQENQKITTFYVITPHINLNQSKKRRVTFY